MTELEEQQRAAVVAEALSWERTPYHHMGRIKGVGVDCATLVAEVFHRAGMIPKVKLAYYPPDWHLNRGDERYRRLMIEHGASIVQREPITGDVVLFRFGRSFSHGAIVIEWPVVIHAYLNQMCIREDYSRATWLQTNEAGKPRPIEVYSFWGA